MALLAERATDARTQRLKDLIEILVRIVANADAGFILQREAMELAARESKLSVTEMPYVVNAAVADNRITADLRSGKLQLVTQ